MPCLGPPGSRCQERVRRAKDLLDLLEETSVKDKEEREQDRVGEPPTAVQFWHL